MRTVNHKKEQRSTITQSQSDSCTHPINSRQYGSSGGCLALQQQNKFKEHQPSNIPDVLWSCHPSLGESFSLLMSITMSSELGVSSCKSGIALGTFSSNLDTSDGSCSVRFFSR